MARKKTPPEYGESDYREVSIAIRSSLSRIVMLSTACSVQRQE
jgi:hypothetical protein